MDLFSVRLSKKTSEAGVWINDQEVADCMICHVRYTLLVRRHHCRRCGAVVCGRCSENRMFLESSRSGTLKRVCDTCFAASRKADEEEEEAEAAEEAATAAARAAMAKASLGGGGGRGAPAPAAAPAAAAAAAPRSSAPRVPEIPTEEAVAALKEHAFDGKWKSILTFTVVDNGGGKPEGEERGGEREGGPRLRAGLGAAVQALTTHDSSSFPLPTPLTLLAVPGLDIGSFKGSGAASASRKSTLTKDGRVRAGSRVELWLHLQPKGAAYFQGACANFGQFGAEGKVTGALQRSLGKVNMTVQMVNNKVTTSFNFVGMVRRRRRCRRFCRGLVVVRPSPASPLSPSPTLPLPSPFPLPPPRPGQPRRHLPGHLLRLRDQQERRLRLRRVQGLPRRRRRRGRRDGQGCRGTDGRRGRRGRRGRGARRNLQEHQGEGGGGVAESEGGVVGERLGLMREKGEEEFARDFFLQRRARFAKLCHPSLPSQSRLRRGRSVAAPDPSSTTTGRAWACAWSGTLR
jgi:hypothetical protein